MLRKLVRVRVYVQLDKKSSEWLCGGQTNEGANWKRECTDDKGDSPITTIKPGDLKRGPTDFNDHYLATDHYVEAV